MPMEGRVLLQNILCDDGFLSSLLSVRDDIILKLGRIKPSIKGLFKNETTQ
jgi:hypothetical protein